MSEQVGESEFQDNDGDAISLHEFELESSSSEDDSHTTLGELDDQDSQDESEEDGHDVPRVSRFIRGRPFQPTTSRYSRTNEPVCYTT